MNRVCSKLPLGELDPAVVIWAMHRHFYVANAPPDGLVLYVEIADVKRLRCWRFIVEPSVE